MIDNTILKQLKGTLLKGQFGLEKENLRVSKDGKLALTPHPAIFGRKTENQFITTDFSESQVEVITPPLPSIEDAHDFIQTLHSVVTDEIGDELLWPQSLPPILPEESLIPIAKYEEQTEFELYRELIATTYGKHRQLICGIHFNISLADQLFEGLHKASNGSRSISELKEEVYLKILRGFMRHRWLIVWMFGETPIAERNFKVKSLTTGEDSPMRCGAGISLRSGPLGYRNKEDYVLDFSSLRAYQNGVDELIREGKLSSAKELYPPVRMKFLSIDHGAPSYLELRLLDLDPLSASGVNRFALYGAHILYLYGLLSDEKEPFDGDAQHQATQRQDYVSCFGRCRERKFPAELAQAPTIVEEVKILLDDIYKVLDQYDIWSEDNYKEAFEHMRMLAANPNERAGIKLFEATKNDQFINFYLHQANKFKEESRGDGFRFYGLSDMEMSTQLMLRAALCRGVGFKILDRKENFVELSRDGRAELVVQATKTSLDNYATILAMENKVVTKKLLSTNDIRVPKGGEYDHKNIAASDLHLYLNRPIVIKPKSTNFGLGITILKDKWGESEFNAGLDIAFTHDSTILIEEFVSGREFRIFVINDQVVGILHRVPANVMGDGVHTIRELIEIKNLDPRRGKGYHTPLEKIATGIEEELFLKLQGHTLDTIPAKEIQIFLRENSNISTGGDSIDFTDDVHHSYKAIAEDAARALNAKITGVDMMIEDIHEPASISNYAIIEMNFNPAIHIHCFPYKGENRRINFKLIEALGY